MSALPPRPYAQSRSEHDQFILSHGKSGAVGVFTAAAPLRLRRGDRAVIQTERGIEVGSVLCPASLQQARILGAVSSGPLLRPLSLDDETCRDELAAREQTIFETSRAWAKRDQLPLEILDAELLFDGVHAIVQFVGTDTPPEAFALSLQEHFGVSIRLENLATPAHEDEAEHGCGKPDCGSNAGGCSTCSTGSGCSSCGSSKVDLRAYFGHLRENMETQRRIPLA